MLYLTHNHYEEEPCPRECPASVWPHGHSGAEVRLYPKRIAVEPDPFAVSQVARSIWKTFKRFLLRIHVIEYIEFVLPPDDNPPNSDHRLPFRK